MIIACGPKRDPVLGIRDGGKGLVTDTHIAWKFKEFPSDCVTPLFYQHKLFVLDGDRQMMTCLEPQTGAKKWQGNLGVQGDLPRLAHGRRRQRSIASAKSGTAVVLEAGDEFKILSTIRMGEAPVRSSIAVAHGELFIRTAKNLYCVRSAGRREP